MVLYIKIFLCVIFIVLCGESMGKEKAALSLLDIYKIRSAKVAKNRIFYGKKTLVKRFKSELLVNGVTDMANRLVCNPTMQKAARLGLGKKLKRNNKAIAAACEVKSRE